MTSSAMKAVFNDFKQNESAFWVCQKTYTQKILIIANDMEGLH